MVNPDVGLGRLFWSALDALSAVGTAVLARIVRRQLNEGPFRWERTYRAWERAGVTPIRHHYYQPVFDAHLVPEEVWTFRDPLTGVDLNVASQLNLLHQFRHRNELARFPHGTPTEPLGFFHGNRSFDGIDAEVLYLVLRHFRPRRVVEVGSGWSTRLILTALRQNAAEGVPGRLTCIEPYEQPWLEQLPVELHRVCVETLPISFFADLEAGDVLFIDSSHTIRVGGDVTYLYLQVLPALKPGVLVHIHDVFLPWEYPQLYFRDLRWFWTEQFLLRAFLTFNHAYEVLLSLHYLAREHREALMEVCQVTRYPDSAACSFWLRVNRCV